MAYALHTYFGTELTKSMALDDFNIYLFRQSVHKTIDSVWKSDQSIRFSLTIARRRAENHST